MKQLSWVTVVLLFCGSLAFANHGSPQDPLNELLAQSQALNNAVQVSTLRYAVKTVVLQFNTDVSALHQCNGEEVSKTLDLLSHHDPDCSTELQKVQTSWQLVDQYLYDTMNDFPTVYLHYTDTKQALSVVVQGNLPPHTQLSSSGSMDSFRYYFLDYTPNGIYNQCMNFGYQRNIGYIIYLTVNGYVYYNGGYYIPLQQACTTVARAAN